MFCDAYIVEIITNMDLRMCNLGHISNSIAELGKFIFSHSSLQLEYGWASWTKL